MKINNYIIILPRSPIKIEKKKKKKKEEEAEEVKEYNKYEKSIEQELEICRRKTKYFDQFAGISSKKA